MSKLSSIGEFGLINLLKSKLPISSDVIKGIGDDTAVIEWSSSEYLLLTTDMIVEGVHFTKTTSPELIGRKALACNVSDVAAMGGIPKFALISIGLPSNLSVEFIKKIYRGIQSLAKQFKVSIVGGDTVKSQKLTINIVLTGEVKKNHLVLRSRAKVGDVIFTTGPLGNSFKSGRHLSFMPRVKESQYLVKHFHPTAMIDISDGLAADLGHILEESKVGALLYRSQVILHKGAVLKNALYDGEDFELLFTLSHKESQKLIRQKSCPYKFYPIGQIVKGRKVLALYTSEGKIKNISTKGFEHF